jgi:hypothetical protein
MHVLRRRGRPVGGGDPGIGRPVAEFLPGVAQEDSVGIRKGRAVVVCRPIREGRDETHRVVALTFPPRQRLFKTDPARGQVIGRRRRAAPRQAPGRSRKPGVAHHEKRRAIGIAQRMPAGGGAHEAPPVGIVGLLRVGPRNRLELARAAIQPGVRRLVGTGMPAPFAGCGRHEAHPESATAIPESIHPLRKARAFQFDPAIHLGIRIGVALRRLENDLLRLPDMNLPRIG